MKNNHRVSIGLSVGFFDLIFIILFCMKITGNTDLPWKIIIAPLWVPVAVLFLILGIAYILFVPTNSGNKSKD